MLNADYANLALLFNVLTFSYCVFITVLSYLERKELTSKIMAKDYADYANQEINRSLANRGREVPEEERISI